MFYHTKTASESKIARKMLCFTKETAVGRRSAMVAYARLCPDRSAIGKCNRRGQTQCNGGFQVALACRWWCGVM